MPVGNDIIDLNRHSVSHRHTDERFIHKILHPQEIELFRQSKRPEYFLWMLWTIKEACYKYCKQADSSFVFSPKKIFIEQSSFEQQFALQAEESFTKRGFEKTVHHMAKTANGMLQTYSVIAPNYIHTVAITAEENINWGVKKITDTNLQTQSDEARAFALSAIGDAKAAMIFNEKIPVIKSGGRQLATSLSHDGFYVSFAIAM